MPIRVSFRVDSSGRDSTGDNVLHLPKLIFIRLGKKTPQPKHRSSTEVYNIYVRWFFDAA
jgi:hypothetical protein